MNHYSCLLFEHVKYTKKYTQSMYIIGRFFMYYTVVSSSDQCKNFQVFSFQKYIHVDNIIIYNF